MRTNLKVIFLLFFVSTWVTSGCDQDHEQSSNPKEIDNSGYRVNFELDSSTNEPQSFNVSIQTPICTDTKVYGTYKGVEFVNYAYAAAHKLTGTDIAHQYSNVISKYVGRKLKAMFIEGNYAKVNLKGIKMTTKGMHDGDHYVEYYVEIPIIRVPKYLATTSFDHCGGWGHVPDIENRLKKLSTSGIVKNKKLDVSPLYKTREGLQEYWIQWQNTHYQ